MTWKRKLFKKFLLRSPLMEKKDLKNTERGCVNKKYEESAVWISAISKKYEESAVWIPAISRYLWVFKWIPSK